jgi:opacity protein-like surface antigen
MKALRGFLCLASAFCAIGAATGAHAQGLDSNPAWRPALRADSLSSTRNSLGLNLGRDRLVGSFWGVELGYLDRAPLFASEPRTQGLNLSLVGRAPLGGSLGVYGKLGTNYGRGDAWAPGASPALAGESSSGFAYSAGMSYSFTPRLSATLEWESNDLRFMGGTRDPVRSTNLGLRYRY